MKKDSIREKALELYKNHKYREITTLLTDELLDKQNNSELYALRAKVDYLLNYNADTTMNFAQKAIDLDPSYFMGYFVKALVMANKDENMKSIENYTKALELCPDFADAYYSRGVAWQNENEYEKAIEDFDMAIFYYNRVIEAGLYFEYPDTYLNRGNTWYYKKEYEKAITDYTEVIESNEDTEMALAYLNRGAARFARKEYDMAIADYTEAISLNPEFLYVYFNDRGVAWKAKKDFDNAIADYTKAIAINSKFANAYYNRGLAKKENVENSVDKQENREILEEIKQDFEKYLELAIVRNENPTKYAKFYLKELDIMISDPELWSIILLIKNIKSKLLLNEECVHYTTISTLKKLILEESKFKIFEGNFLNDPSEGEEFFNFLRYKHRIPSKISYDTEIFSPKPFIGSFVTKDKIDDLNMWRLYGKEEGKEAKGCSITVDTQEFVDDVKKSLSNEKNKDARLDDESDISFYRVAYIDHGLKKKFHILNLDKECKELRRLMTDLKAKVAAYKDKTVLEKYLNNIAFLFKSDVYKDENEVRLVVKGIEFKKKYAMDVIPPRVYIELESIKKRIKQVTLGPKADNVSEWASVFHHCYIDNAPGILISHKPFR
jgi:tetratricopeptide (TPR) repeat protein